MTLEERVDDLERRMAAAERVTFKHTPIDPHFYELEWQRRQDEQIKKALAKNG